MTATLLVSFNFKSELNWFNWRNVIAFVWKKASQVKSLVLSTERMTSAQILPQLNPSINKLIIVFHMWLNESIMSAMYDDVETIEAIRITDHPVVSAHHFRCYWVCQLSQSCCLLTIWWKRLWLLHSWLFIVIRGQMKLDQTLTEEAAELHSNLACRFSTFSRVNWLLLAQLNDSCHVWTFEIQRIPTFTWLNWGRRPCGRQSGSAHSWAYWAPPATGRCQFAHGKTSNSPAAWLMVLNNFWHRNAPGKTDWLLSTENHMDWSNIMIPPQCHRCWARPTTSADWPSNAIQVSQPVTWPSCPSGSHAASLSLSSQAVVL